MTRYTCEEMGVCKGTACPTCPHDAGLPKGQCAQAAPVRRETDAQNLLEWQNAMLAQALAERQDAEDRERMLKVLAQPRPKLKPFPPPWQRTKDAIDSDERELGNAEFLRALLICTACFWAVIGLALWLF
jgi:hypothetical protein